MKNSNSILIVTTLITCQFISGCKTEEGIPTPDIISKGPFDFVSTQSFTPELNGEYETLVADVNGDKSIDIILSSLNEDVNEVQIILGSSSGAFTPLSKQIHPITAPNGTTWSDYELKMGDINGDGRADFIWNNNTSRHGKFISDNSIYSGLSDGNGSVIFNEVPEVFNDNWGNIYEFYIADVNGDNRDDVVWNQKSGFSNTVVSALSTVDGFELVNEFQNYSTLDISNWQDWELYIVDLNGDGIDDLAWEETGLNARLGYAIAENEGSGEFDFTPIYTFGMTHWMNYYNHFGDVDGDGKDDLILEDTDPSRSPSDFNAIWVGITDGQTIATKKLTVNVAHHQETERYKTAVGDYNGDGRIDILWNNLAGNTNEIVIGYAKTTQGDSDIFDFESEPVLHPDDSQTWTTYDAPIAVNIDTDKKKDILWIRSGFSVDIAVAISK